MNLIKCLIKYIIPIYLISTAFAADSNYYYYNSDSLKTSSYDYSDSTSSYDYYDDYYHDVYDDKKNAQTDSEKPPHECPMQCKCIFSESQEQNGHEENLIYESNDDYEHEAEESYRKKRTLNSSYDYDDYSYDYSTKSPVAPTKRKYDIYIDCSSQNLNSISYLFAYDFPLDQIISFNLSNNRFRVLRLDDGFEDLINLRILDISSNNYLRSPSPKYFLKKFRHLEKILMNNLDQINCDQALNSNKLVSIDCKWLRTILYLFKRNVSVIIDKPNRCDVNKLVNSVSLMSRCFRDLYNSYRFTETNQTLLSTDNSKFEFRIEPELNQILIEGDTLELTCKLKKINLLKKFRHRSSNFYKSQIKWFLNEQTQLMISTIYYTKDTPTQIQIVENKSKFKLDDLIESKLIITNTISGQHTGKYSCVAGLYLNEKRLNVNTSRVEIKVLTRHQLNVIEPSVQETKQKSPYCPEIITQTYKGIFKWPRTLANSKITQKCSGANSSAFAIFECKQDGQWSDFMDLSACFFESNLTKYLFGLEKGKKEIDLEEFIRQIISIQSNHNTSVKQSLNKFDVINVQKYLIYLMRRNRSEVLDSNSWKHEFMFLNDMLSKLNEFYLIQAKLANLEVYGNYFFNVLMEVLGSSIHSTQGIQSDLLSSYLAMHSISANTNRNLKNNLSCKIKRYQLTQQIYFKCNDQVDDQVTSRIDLDHQMINSYSRFSKKLEFIFFENDHLLPSVIANQTHENLSNYDLINLVDYNSLLDSNELSESTGKLISQIVGFISTPNFNQPNNFNLSLEIKMPDLYFRVLGLIDSKLELKRAEINKKNLSLNHKKTEKDKNLFDQIFVQNSLLTETNSLYFDISSSTPKTSNNVLLMNKNLKLKNYDSSIQQIYEKHFLTNSKRLKNFKNLLIKNWFRVHNYQVLYGMFKNDTNGPHIEWSEKNFNAFCDIRRLLSSTNSTKYALYSHLKCNLTAKNPNIHFIGLRHSPHHTELTQSQPPNPHLASIIHLIDEYAQLFRINIKDDLTTNLSIMAQIRAILHHNYQFFGQKVLYFFSLVSILILSANIVIYLILKKSLLMPRSFQHCIINKWLSVLSLILFFIVGIKQIFIPHLCLITAIGSHFLMLASFLWYLLYYWCLYSKLRVLEKRNFNLIFNNNNIQLKKLSEHEEEEEYVKKPVVHLYMLGYGIPILLVSIIISITKRDYVQVPYSVCFTNEPNILIGSIILPVCFVFLVQLVLVGLIWATLRRIVKDLNMEDLESKPEDPKINEEKKELCKNWLINRDLNVNDCIEVKTNPSTQKSVVNFNRDVYPESNTSFNSDSDRTSIMDTQHKPHIQLKFSLFSSVIFLSICLLAGCASTLDHDLAFTYLLSLALFVYSVLEISFYVLSRDDLFSLDLNFSFSFSNDKNKSDESTESHSNETNSQDNNWYFEPNEEKTECPKIEDLYERFNFNDLNSTKKNVTNTILEEESMEEDDHKRSISDALFSAKKSHSMVTRNVDEIVDESKTTDLRPSLAMSEDLSESTVCSQKFYESRSKKVKKSSYSYEEKNRNDQVIIEEYVSKLDDLLSSNCLVNTGAAAETVATIAKVKRRSNSSMTSSVVTTSNESNFNANHVTNPNLVVNSYLGDDDIYNSNSIYHVGSISQRSSSVCSNVWQKNSIERTSGKFATRNKPYATPRKAANLSINHETSV